MLTSLQTILAAEVHLVEDNILLQEHIMNTEESLIYQAANQRTSFQKRTAEVRAKVNLGKKQCINVMPPLM
jgi:hypothetical protein